MGRNIKTRHKKSRTRKSRSMTRNRRQSRKARGGSIEPNNILSKIESIGYEFESGNFITMQKSIVNNNYSFPNLSTTEMYTILANQEQEVIENIPDVYNFVMSNDMGGDAQLKMLGYSASQLYVDNLTNHTNIHIKDSNPDMFLQTSKYSFSDLECITTYYNVTEYDRSNVIQATFKHAIRKLYDYLTHPKNVYNVEIKPIINNLKERNILKMKEFKQPKQLFEYENNFNLLMVEPYTNTGVPIQYARFVPQMTFGVPLKDSYDVMMYILENNLMPTNDPNNEIDKQILEMTINKLKEANTDSLSIVSKIKSCLEYMLQTGPNVEDYMKKWNLTKEQADAFINSLNVKAMSNFADILIFILYLQWIIDYFDNMPQSEEKRHYYKDYILMNLRNRPKDMLKKYLGEQCVNILADLPTICNTSVSNSPELSVVNDIFINNQLVKIIFEGGHLVDYASDEVKFAVIRYYDLPAPDKDVILIEYRGFLMSLNKTLRKYVDPNKLHNQILDYSVSLELLKEYADYNGQQFTSPPRETRKRKTDFTGYK